MDKKAWIVIIACSIGLYFWLDTQKEYQKKLQKQKDNAQQTSEDVAVSARGPESPIQKELRRRQKKGEEVAYFNLQGPASSQQ